MTHPCDQERLAAMADRTVISLAYTPEIYARKRAQQRAREAWRQAQELSQRLMAGPALHMHPAIIALVHVIARSAARATMLGTDEATGYVPHAASGPTPDKGNTMSNADMSLEGSRLDPVSVSADRAKDCDDRGNGHHHNDTDDFGDVSF